MTKATNSGGVLNELSSPQCYIDIPGGKKFVLSSLPSISDSKSAKYSDESSIGRTAPFKTYATSENRTISMTIHLFNTGPGSSENNYKFLRAIQSAVYPDVEGTSYIPPPICKIKCGDLLSKNALCVVLEKYSVQFPEDVAWDEQTYLPFKFDISTDWTVVYSNAELPGTSKIIGD